MGLTNIINKTSTKIFLSLTVILNLRHTLQQLRFKSNSNCLPDKLPNSVETFITAINQDIKSFKTKKLSRDNLTKSEREALLDIQKKVTSLSQKLPKEALWYYYTLTTTLTKLPDNLTTITIANNYTSNQQSYILKNKIRNKQLKKRRQLEFKNSKLYFKREN